MQRVIIVDGHSAIFSIEHFSALHEHNAESGRDALTLWLNHFNDVVEDAVIVVFDGKGKSRGTILEDNNILVMYSKEGQTADSLIERIVAQKSGKYDITVATNDRMERETVMAFGAHAIRIDAFVEMVDSTIGSKW